jgi:hypothetical protein
MVFYSPGETRNTGAIDVLWVSTGFFVGFIDMAVVL